MSDRNVFVKVSLTRSEALRLDEMRGEGKSRSGFLRALLRQAGPLEEAPTRRESLRLLAESARIARELREEPERDLMDWVLNGE